MSMNQRYKYGQNIDLPVPSGTVSGDYVVVGNIKGVANIDRAEDGTASVVLYGSFNFTTKGEVAGPANSAIAVGDRIYFASGATPQFSKTNTGVYVGMALTTLVSGATGIVEVLLDPSDLA